MVAGVGNNTRQRKRTQSSSTYGIYALGKAHMRSTSSLGSFPRVAFAFAKQFQRLKTCLIDDGGPFSSSQGKSLSASSFYASLPEGDRWCDVLDFNCVSSSSVNISDLPRCKPPVMRRGSALPASLSVISLDYRHVSPGQYPTP